MYEPKYLHTGAQKLLQYLPLARLKSADCATDPKLETHNMNWLYVFCQIVDMEYKNIKY